jgi:hypothetical protein
MTKKHERCAHCGGDGMFVDNGRDPYFVICTGCGARGPLFIRRVEGFMAPDADLSTTETRAWAMWDARKERT